MKLSLITGKCFLALLLIACVLGIWQAQIGYRADLLYERSQTLQESWQGSPDNLAVDNWQAAGQDLLGALILNENEAEYLHQYGLLLSAEQDLLGEAISAEDLQRIATNSFEAHRLGIRQRPASPFGWTWFALSKALAGQFDAEFDLALERSNALGPWEKNNHRVIAGIASYYWELMSDSGRAYSLQALNRALSTSGFDEPALSYLNSSVFLQNQLCALLDLTVVTEATRTACQIP